MSSFFDDPPTVAEMQTLEAIELDRLLDLLKTHSESALHSISKPPAVPRYSRVIRDRRSLTAAARGFFWPALHGAALVHSTQHEGRRFYSRRASGCCLAASVPDSIFAGVVGGHGGGGAACRLLLRNNRIGGELQHHMGAFRFVRLQVCKCGRFLFAT